MKSRMLYTCKNDTTLSENLLSYYLSLNLKQNAIHLRLGDVPVYQRDRANLRLNLSSSTLLVSKVSYNCVRVQSSNWLQKESKCF